MSFVKVLWQLFMLASVVTCICLLLVFPGQSDSLRSKYATKKERQEPGLILKDVLGLFSREFLQLEFYREEFLNDVYAECRTNCTNETFLEPKLAKKQYKIAVEGRDHFGQLDKYQGIKTINFSLPYETVSKIWPYKVYLGVVSKNVTYRKKPLSPTVFEATNSYKKAIESPQLPKYDFLQTTHINQKEPVLLTFLHIVRNGVAFRDGAVAHSDVHINIHGCKYKSYKKVRTADKLSMHDEVFTISQFWGSGFFHSTVENIPRLALYVEFLKDHPGIKILVISKKSFTKNFIRTLGLTNDIITGHVKARVIYAPAGVHCGRATTFPSFVLNLRLRDLIETPDVERKSVVLIKRSRRRWFGKHKDIWSMLQKHQKSFGYKLELFSDRKMPKFNDTMKMFNRALMVIGPHGAGLSNVFFSQPGTVVIEGLCNPLNLCYSRLSRVLHHIYFGIIPERSCRETTDENVEEAVLPYLKWLSSTRKL